MPCSECDAEAVVAGWCRKHYDADYRHRKRKHGRPKPIGRPCSIDDCDGRSVEAGKWPLCPACEHLRLPGDDTTEGQSPSVGAGPEAVALFKEMYRNGDLLAYCDEVRASGKEIFGNLPF